MAASEGSKELIWLGNPLTELELPFDKPKLYIDNLPSIKSFENNKTQKGIRHVGIRYRHICDSHNNKSIEINRVSTEEQISNLLTKAYQGNRLDELKEKIGVRNLKEESSNKPYRNKRDRFTETEIKEKLIALLTISTALIVTNINAAEHTPKLVRAPWIIWTKTTDSVDTGLAFITAKYSQV